MKIKLFVVAQMVVMAVKQVLLAHAIIDFDFGTGGLTI